MTLPLRGVGLHGREADRRVVTAVLEAVRAGRSGVLVLRGPAGIGKTALLEDVVGNAPVHVLRARCVESESELPFSALQQLLHPVIAHAEELPAHQHRALRIALGMEDDPDAPAPTDRFFVALAVLGLLAAAARADPVVCVIDDAHWLDQASAATLLFVARRLGADPVGVLFAVRDPGVRDFPSSGLPELRMEGLDVAAAMTLLAERTGRAVDPGACAHLVEWTGGNPLALIEIPSVLSSEQLAGRSRMPAPLPLPLLVERIFTDRVGGLPAPSRALLLVAAAEGGGPAGRVQAAGRLLGLPGTALEPAERSGLITIRQDAIAFAHPLVGSAVYQAAHSLERRRVHLALSRAAAEAGDLDRRAWHLAAAAQGPDDAVAAELEVLAARAGSRGAFAAAAASLERAAELSTEETARCRRLLSAAQSAWLAGRLSTASELLQRARPMAESPLLLADVDQLRGWLEFVVGSPTAARRILVGAATEVVAADSARARRMLGGAAESAWLSSDQETGDEIRRVMSRLDPARDDPERLAADLISAFLSLLDGDPATGSRLLTGALRTAEQSGDERLLRDAAQHAFYVGDDASALRLSGRAVAEARARGGVTDLLVSLPRLAHAEFLRGNWAATAADAAEAVQLAEDAGRVELSALPLAWRALVACLRNSPHSAHDSTVRLEALAESHALGVYRVAALEIVRWGRATEHLVAARPGSAFLFLDGLQHPVVTAMAGLDRIEAAAQSGLRDAAQRWLRDVEVLAAATGHPSALALAAHGRGVLSDGPVGAEHFSEALRHHRAAARPFARGRTSLAYGEALRRARHRVEARPHLGTALELFESLGAPAWADRARRELRACGQSAQRRDPSELLRLTPQELQVARFVARGLPTRAVAAQLFLTVSPRTVDFHLRNVFTKLGISSRAELAAHQLA